MRRGLCRLVLFLKKKNQKNFFAWGRCRFRRPPDPKTGFFVPKFMWSAPLLLAFAGCIASEPPGVDFSALTRAALADPARNIQLMQEAGEKLSDLPYVPGNRVQLLINGPASFAALASAIRSARHRIDMESYEYDAVAGAQFSALLIAAHARGVEVNLIHDGWGALESPGSVFDTLRRGGVRVVTFHPLLTDPLQINQRDHRKLLVADGRIAITGGVNITKVYENPLRPRTAPVDDQAWRDTDVRIEGPVAVQFERFFVATWRSQGGPRIADPPAAAAPDGPTTVQAIDGTPGRDEPLIYRSLLASMALALRSIHLTTGFFVPTPDLMRGLELAARRGVDVELVLPGKSDSETAVAGGRASYGPLLEAGVRIFERQFRILHAKTAVIDGAWSAVGSSNLDWRSAIWNNEVDAVILGPEFGAQMEAAFQRDRAASREVTLAQWRHRGLLERLDEWKAALLRVLL